MGPQSQRSVMASAELVWLCVRNNSCYLQKKGDATFTSEPNNLVAKNSFRYSGLANKKTKAARKPADLFVSRTLNKDIRRVARSIKNTCSGYRPDLEHIALARATALFRAKRNEGAKPKPHRIKGVVEDEEDED